MDGMHQDNLRLSGTGSSNADIINSLASIVLQSGNGNSLRSDLGGPRGTSDLPFTAHPSSAHSSASGVAAL